MRDVVYSMLDPWRKTCIEEFGLPATPQVANSWYRTWYAAVTAGQTASSVTVRAGSAWHKLKHFLKTHELTAITATLNPPATDEQIIKVEETLGLELPAALKALYKVHDGQSTNVDRIVDSNQPFNLESSIFQGLFGGYSAYDFIACTRLLPLARCLRYTRMCRDNRVIPPSSTLLVFAASFDFSRIFFVETMTGQVRLRPTGCKRRTNGVLIIITRR